MEITQLKEWIDKSRRIVFFGGAGVSVASGIPDFKSEGGLYSEEYDGRFPEEILSATYFTLNTEKFYDFYRKYMLHPEARPNAVHRKLFELEQQDKYTGIGACREISGCDMLIVAGTSLSVEPAASYLQYYNGKHLVVINKDATPADDRADLVIREDVNWVFEQLG